MSRAAHTDELAPSRHIPIGIRRFAGAGIYLRVVGQECPLNPRAIVAY